MNKEISKSVFGKIPRVICCQKKHLFAKLLRRYKYQIKNHPYFVSSLWYGINTGKLPNLRHPHNFNELLMRINIDALLDPKQHAIRVNNADKYAVRQYIIEKGYEDILNECYGVYNSFDEIDFSKLPTQFVLKCTTGCGMNFICKDKETLDLKALKRLCTEWFEKSKTFGFDTAEWHYSEIKPRLIIEKYLSQLGEDTSLIDYKFHCFNGQIYHVGVGYDRDPISGKASFSTYDTEWKNIDLVLPEYYTKSRDLPCPKQFERMKQIAQDLSSDVKYVRVDLYEVDNKVLFGELTYTPSGNFAGDFKPHVLIDLFTFYQKTLK